MTATSSPNGNDPHADIWAAVDNAPKQNRAQRRRSERMMPRAWKIAKRKRKGR